MRRIARRTKEEKRKGYYLAQKRSLQKYSKTLQTIKNFSAV